MFAMTTPNAPRPLIAPDATPAMRVSRGLFLTGWVLSAVPSALLIFSAAMKFAGTQQVVEGFEHLGWPASRATMLGVLELTCTLLFLIPRTAVLGAILIAGYMGGAIATHLRMGEPVFVQAGVGVVMWLGLYLREPRLHSLLPLRRGSLGS